MKKREIKCYYQTQKLNDSLRHSIPIHNHLVISKQLALLKQSTHLFYTSILTTLLVARNSLQ